MALVNIVIPILKPDKNHSLPGIFLPISLTSYLFKLLERKVAEYLVWVLESVQGLFPLQFWFRRFRSTADPLLRLEYDISAAFENGKFVLAVLFDLQKAGFCVNSFLSVLWTFTYIHLTFVD